MLSVAIALNSCCISAQELDRYRYQSTHMGSLVTIQLYAESEAAAAAAAAAAFDRIEELNRIMSDYMPQSELNRLSNSAGSGESVKVSEPLYEVLLESVRISKMTNGAFDVTIGLLTRAWRMIRMLPEPELPDREELEQMLARTGYHFIHIDEENRAVTLKKEGMRLDLGGIAKGYAVEQAIRVLQESGINSALVDAGGDIALGAAPPGRNHWEVAVPVRSADGETTFITLALSGKTVTTSGDMFQYVEIDGTRYSHILHPETGLGTTHQTQATVISKAGIYADALASALTVMNPDDGIALIDSMDDTEAIIFLQTKEGIRQQASRGFNRYLK